MIVKINGTCGAGKTTIVRSIVDGLPPDGEVIRDGYIWPDLKLVILGHYYRKKGNKWSFYHTGGSDHFYKSDVVRMLYKYNKDGYDILFENSNGSRSLKDWDRVADTIGRQNMVWLYLNTSLEQCRINKTERKRKHHSKTASMEDTMKHLDTGYEMCEKTRILLAERGYRVEYLSVEETMARTLELLNLDPTIPFVPK